MLLNLNSTLLDENVIIELLQYSERHQGLWYL